MLHLKDGVVIEDIEESGNEEAIIMDTNTGTYMTANATATLMIKTLQRSRSYNEAISILTRELNAEKQAVESDVATLIDSLKELGIWESSGASPV